MNGCKPHSVHEREECSQGGQNFVSAFYSELSRVLLKSYGVCPLQCVYASDDVLLFNV